MPKHPADWPLAGPIDLGVHDLPHASSLTEWWYVNAYVTSAEGHNLALFASFFRVARGRQADGKPRYAHALTWALVDLDRKHYWPESLVDRDAPRMGLEKLERGEGAKDERLRRALREILERGNVPYPDQMFQREPIVALDQLTLDFDGRSFRKEGDAYLLELSHSRMKLGCTLRFVPDKAPIRHGIDGVVRGPDGGDMFYYCVPRCAVRGSVTLNGREVPITQGQGWYDHEFGGHRAEEAPPMPDDVAWNWCAVQLAGGVEVTAYTMQRVSTGESLGAQAIVVDRDGTQRNFASLRFEAQNSWRSTRTFNEYPTRWYLAVPDARLQLDLTPALDDQELITLISKPAFWEGACFVDGVLDGQPVHGRAWVERSGFASCNNLDDFFRAVGDEVRKSVRRLLPLEPQYAQVRDLIASEARDHYMDGVKLEQIVRAGIKPVREITDRGGKGWRSYAALACCDVVGGDSRDFVQWLAMPELMHVGSLIVDDVQDKSEVRRGGPACHVIYGDALAINAGTAAYFMGQQLLQSPRVSDRDRLRLYDLYFEALRAGHAGQALDLDGLDTCAAEAADRGDALELERRILAVHRLKTAGPAAALARMGAIVGGGSDVQVEALGRYFESVGLAFQIVDDVLNLRGFKNDLKRRGEDVAQGKVTLPFAKALARLPRGERLAVWRALRQRSPEPAHVAGVIDRLEACGAVEACAEQARRLVEEAWAGLHPHVEDSMVKLMLRSFGWYVIERHY